MHHYREWEPRVLGPDTFLDYTAHIEAKNVDTHAELRSHFDALLFDQDLSGTVLLLPGSDGKFERHEQSRHELIVVGDHPAQQTAQFAATIHERLVQAGLVHEFDLAYHGGLESKTLGQDVPFSFVEDNSTLVYPDRILNSVLVAGDPSVMYAARRRTLSELAMPGGQGRHIRDAIRQQLRSSRKAALSGRYRNALHFDEATGMQYYSENPPLSFGFKSGYIRLVHRKLDRMTEQLAADPSHLDVLAQTLPTNTVRRLEYFQAIGMIDPTLSLEVQRAYTWFLLQYHSVQETYKNSGTINHERPVAEMPFDLNTYRSFSDVLIQFSNV